MVSNFSIYMKEYQISFDLLWEVFTGWNLFDAMFVDMILLLPNWSGDEGPSEVSRNIFTSVSAW